MATFPYNLNIPAGPDNPSNDRPLMTTNTNSINSIIGQDHVTFGSVAGQDGMHTVVHLVNQAVDPGAFAGGVTLYSKQFLSTGVDVLFSKSSNGSVFPMYAIMSTNPGYTYASGTLIQFGKATTTGTVNFAIPFPNAIFSAVVTGNLSGGATITPNPIFYTQNVLLNKFDIVVNGSGNPTNYAIYWVAIGF